MYFLLLIAGFPLVIADGISIKDIPHHVTVEHKGGLLCHGAILSEFWIVTTVSCAPDNPAKPLAIIRAGSDQRKKEGTTYEIRDVIKHESNEFSKGGFNKHEIALIRLKEPIVFDDTRKKIELFKSEEILDPGTIGFVTGFGKDDFYNNLQKLELSIMDNAKCNEAYKNEGGLPEGYICAVYENTVKTTLQLTYELGSPLVVGGRLAGLLYTKSRDLGESSRSHPELFTDITYYQLWIDHSISLTNKKYG